MQAWKWFNPFSFSDKFHSLIFMWIKIIQRLIRLTSNNQFLNSRDIYVTKFTKSQDKNNMLRIIHMDVFAWFTSEKKKKNYSTKKSKSTLERQRIKSHFNILRINEMQRKYKVMLRRRVKDNGTLTCGLKGLCILRASGSPPACENTTRDGGGRWFGTYAELSI